MRGCGRVERPAFPAPSEFQMRFTLPKLARTTRRECRGVCVLHPSSPRSGGVETSEARSWVAHRERSERCDGWGAVSGKRGIRALAWAAPTRRFAPPSPQKVTKGGGIRKTKLALAMKPVARMSEARSGASVRNRSRISLQQEVRGIPIVRETGATMMLSNSSRSIALHGGLEFFAEFGKFIGGEIADRPVVQAAVAPGSDVESLKRFSAGRTAQRCWRSG